MWDDWQNNSSIYLKQINKFHRWIIYPTLLLFIGVLLFLVICSSEIVILSKGKITPKDILTVQIPIEAHIKENKLSENLVVQKGEPLIFFDMDVYSNRHRQLKEEVALFSKRIEALNTFIESLETENNLFTENDEYGYANQISAFFKEKEQMELNIKQIENNYQEASKSFQNKANQLSKQINNQKNNLDNWMQVRSAWINQQKIENYSSDIMSKYSLWQQEIDQAKNEEKEQLKGTILVEIDALINQLQQTIEQLELTQTEQIKPTSVQDEINQQVITFIKLKEEQISMAKNNRQDLTLSKEKSILEIEELSKQLKLSVYRAPTNGVIHLKDDYQKVTSIPVGTVIAEIYPTDISGKMMIVSQIPATEMTHIKVGMNIRFKLDKKGISEKSLEGKLTEISENSYATENGTFYSVKGLVTIPKGDSFRYGLTGNMSLILGKKTYWKQLKEFIFK